MVNYVKTHDEFRQLLKDNPKVIVDFTASWCPPCRMIAPKYEEMAAENPGIVFVKVDVDENGDTAAAQSIEAMPTFKFFLDGENVPSLTVRGASENNIRENIKKFVAM